MRSKGVSDQCAPAADEDFGYRKVETHNQPVTMMANSVYKKNSRNGSICLYLGKRDFVDHVDQVDIVDGVLKVDTSKLDGRKVFVQLACFFHYGKEDLDVISLSFRKDIWIQHIQIYPPPAEDKTVSTPMQVVLKKKAGEEAYPFTFNIPANLPCSVSFLPAAWDNGKACGVDFKIIAYIANEAKNPEEKIDKKDTCQLIIRKIQFAPDKLLPGPEVNIYKQFMLSGKTIHMEASIQKEVYYHGEPIQIRVKINNQTKKVVKKIKISIDQTVDIELYSTDKYTKVVLCEEFRDQVIGQTTFDKEYIVTPLLANNKEKYGLALDGRLKDEDTNLASSTIRQAGMYKDIQGILVSYKIRVNLLVVSGGVLGSIISSYVTAEIPLILMTPKPKDMAAEALQQ